MQELVAGVDELRRLEQNWEQLLKENPNERRALHTRLAHLGEAEVDAAIVATGMNNPARVQRWQMRRVGSGGGYMAVRSVSGTDEIKRTPNSRPQMIHVPWVVNSLENGHKTRASFTTGKSGRTNAESKKPYVNGYHFYSAARRRFEAVAVQEIEKFADRIAERMGG